MKALAATSPKAKAVSKVIRWPLCFMHWDASDSLLAFLDDLNVVTKRERARAARDTVVGVVEAECGRASNISNEGKT